MRLFRHPYTGLRWYKIWPIVFIVAVWTIVLRMAFG